MDIIVTVYTGGSEIPEYPGIFLIQMAKAAGRGHMGPGQGKLGLLMIFKTKGASFEAIYSMTGSAIPDRSFIHKLPLMMIRMAIQTLAMGQRIGQCPFMTCPTIYQGMFTFQGKMSQVVIKGIGRGGNGPALLTVAFPAIQPKSTFVSILMAHRT
jgi:hypothetical protein